MILSKTYWMKWRKPLPAFNYGRQADTSSSITNRVDGWSSSQWSSDELSRWECFTKCWWVRWINRSGWNNCIQDLNLARVKPGCYIDSDRQGLSNPESNRSHNSKALKPKSNPLSTKSNKTLNSNIPESQQSLQKQYSVKHLFLTNQLSSEYWEGEGSLALSHPNDNWTGDMLFVDVPQAPSKELAC